MKSTLTSLAMALLTLAAPLAAHATGFENGNAGDAYAAEFILTAKDMATRLRALPASELRGVNTDQLSGAIITTTVHSAERLSLRGEEVDAINYPDKKLIRINRSRWRNLRVGAKTVSRFTLALHEYLGIMGLDDSQYRLSSPLVSRIDINDYSPTRFWNPLNPASRIGLNLLYAPDDCAVGGLDFDVNKADEQQTALTTGNCGKAYRKVVVTKSSSVTPPDSHAHGTFHRFDLAVYDRDSKLLGRVEYEPEWGICLLPKDTKCQLSGKLRIGGVEFNFWMLRQ